MELELIESGIGNFYIPTDTPDCTICEVVRKGCVYDEGIYLRVLENIKPDINVIDVGLCFGQMTILFAKRCKELGCGKVYSFEANPSLINIIKKSLKANDCDNVELYNNAVWDVGGQELRFQNKDTTNKDIPFSYGNLGVDLSNRGEQVVESVTIDSFGFTNVCAMKIDAQGADLKILKGARNTITKNEPFIAFECEIQNSQNFNEPLTAHFDFTKEVGYEVTEERIGLGNYFAVPGR